MVNPLRNETLVTLNGTEYLLRATFGALVEIEQMTGKSIPKLMEGISNNDLSIAHSKAVFVAGIKGAEVKPDEAKLEQDMMSAGLSEVNHGVVAFLMSCTFGGEKIKKN